MLTELERQEIPRYQYRGGDSSLIYKYLLSPLAQACVDYLTPEWMAPNLITLIGLLATLSAAFLTILYNPALSMHHSYRNYDGNSYSNSNSNSNGDGEEDGNSGNSSYGDSTSYGNNNSDSHIRWLYLYTGISILIYQTLDNMDGKQARKTKTSSPLGMLFDHGCDAINAGITAIPIGSVLGTGWSVGIFFSLYCGFVPFYFQTWEEYYSGAMVLPIINGPTEGLLIAVGMCFTSFLFGADWWHQNIPALTSAVRNHFSLDNVTITPFRFMVIIAVIGAIITVAAQTVTVIKLVREKGGSVVTALAELLPFIVFFASVFSWCYFREQVLREYPYLIMIYTASTFVEISTHLMLKNISRGVIKPLERYCAWIGLFLPFSGVISFFSGQLNKSQTTIGLELFTLVLCSMFSLIVTAFRLHQMCTEVAKVLDINIFTIGERSKRD